MLLHELAGTPSSVEPVAERLRSRGLTVRTPLLPGHGTRWQDLGSVSWHDWHRAGVTALQQAAEDANGRPVVLAGVSVGGALALRLAALEVPRVKAVVAINTALQNRNPLLPLVPVLRFVVRSLPNGPAPTAGADPARTSYPRLSTRAITQLPPLWRDVRGRLHQIKAPVLVLRSLSEGEDGEQTTRIIRDGVSDAPVDEVVLEHSGHVATQGEEAPRIADLIGALADPARQWGR